ncbi:MAG: hypothetical protein GY875_09840 [Gammaproteobacteria bacterium]|nr:hypothetical protein [Gammaproteobacteria bacterium]
MCLNDDQVARAVERNTEDGDIGVGKFGRTREVEKGQWVAEQIVAHDDFGVLVWW